MSDWDKMAKAFDFIEAVIPYLDEMASRGDYQAKMLHEQAVAVLEEGD
jgi:hypothetical protein